MKLLSFNEVTIFLRAYNFKILFSWVFAFCFKYLNVSDLLRFSLLYSLCSSEFTDWSSYLVEPVPPKEHISGNTSALILQVKSVSIYLTYGYILRISSLEDAYIPKFYCANKKLMPEMYLVQISSYAAYFTAACGKHLHYIKPWSPHTAHKHPANAQAWLYSTNKVLAIYEGSLVVQKQYMWVCTDRYASKHNQPIPLYVTRVRRSPNIAHMWLAGLNTLREKTCYILKWVTLRKYNEDKGKVGDLDLILLRRRLFIENKGSVGNGRVLSSLS